MILSEEHGCLSFVELQYQNYFIMTLMNRSTRIYNYKFVMYRPTLIMTIRILLQKIFNKQLRIEALGLLP